MIKYLLANRHSVNDFKIYYLSFLSSQELLVVGTFICIFYVKKPRLREVKEPETKLSDGTKIHTWMPQDMGPSLCGFVFCSP